MRNEYLQLPIMDFAIPTFPIVLLGCANTTAVLQTGVVAGICFHFLVAAPTVEFERYMRRFIAAAGLFSGGDLTVSLFFTGRSTTAALAHLIMPWSGFVVGLLLSLTIYRLFFHRCQIFPGPVAAKLTRFYASYLNAPGEQFNEKLKAIHTEYGDYARIGECFSLCLRDDAC
jgi:hypothetical protein